MSNPEVQRRGVGRDVGGLVVALARLAALGAVVVLLSGIAILLGLLAASLVGGLLVGLALFVWHRRHPGPNRPVHSLRPE
jgi:hypothetical protein